MGRKNYFLGSLSAILGLSKRQPDETVSISAKHLLSWGLFALFLVWYFVWYSTHGRYIPLEVGATLYDIWAAQFGLAHIPFYATIRPGFIINTPLMMMGIGPLGLNIFFQIIVCLTPFLLMYALRPKLLSHPFAPWLTLLAYPLAARPMDYETAPVLFLVIALSLFFLSQRKQSCQHVLLIVAAAISVAYASFSSLGVMPMIIWAVLVVACLYRDRSAFLFAFLSLVFLSGLCYWYYVQGDILYSIISHSDRLHSHSQLIGQLEVKLTYLITFVFSILIGVAFSYICYDLKLFAKKYFVSGLLIFSLAMNALNIVWSLCENESVWFDGLSLIFLTLALASLLFYDRKLFSKNVICFLLVLIGFFIAQRVNSYKPTIFMFYYMPYICLMLGVLIFTSTKRKLRFFGLCP